MSDTNVYADKYEFNYKNWEKLVDDVETLKKRVEELEKLTANLNDKLKLASLGFPVNFIR